MKKSDLLIDMPAQENLLSLTHALIPQLSHQRELAEDFDSLLAGIETEGHLTVRQLQLCQMRLSYLHQNRPPIVSKHRDHTQLTESEIFALQTGDFEPCFSAQECELLALTDKMSQAVHAITDDEVASIQQQLGNAATVNLMTAIALYDARCRLSNVLNS